MADRRRVSQRPFAERRRGSVLVGQRSIDIMNMNQNGEDGGPRFVKFIIRQYKRWGYFICDHDWKAMLICTAFSLLGLANVVFTPQQNDITGYTPYGARAIDEYSVYQDFFSENGLGVTVYLFALAKDGGTMLRDSHLKETIAVLDRAMDTVNLTNSKGESKPFSKFCKSFCRVNEPVRQFYNGFKIQSELAAKKQKLNGRLVLNYPQSTIFGQSFTLQQNFYGMEFWDDREARDTLDILEQAEDGNGTDVTTEQIQSHVSNMKSVKMVVMQLRAEHDPTWTNAQVKQYEMDMVEAFERKFSPKHLQLYVLSQTYVENEMIRAGISLLPYLTVGFFIMCACSVISVTIRAVYMQQHSLPKILLAITACVLPFMSCATALGLLFFCGMRFSSILCVIPFLVLAIGVDSSYLMIHEWQRVCKHSRDHPSRKSMQVGYRVAEVLSEVGPAILISVLTNVFADGVGSFTSSPEITLLCVGNLTSMIVAYIYQMTFYAGLFSLVGRYEIAQERKERSIFEASLRTAKFDRKQHLQRQPSKFHDNTKEAISHTMEVYVSIVANKFVASLTILVYFMYLAFSIYGITQMNINLTTQKLFAADSPLLELDKLRVEYQVPHFTMATVFVNQPGNLSDPKRLERLNEFVEDMEKIRGSWGKIGTQYFVRDYETFQGTFDDFDVDALEAEEEAEDNGVSAALTAKKPLPFDGDDLDHFVKWPEYSFWSGFLQLDNKTHDLERFFFTTGYHGKEISIWTKRGELLNTWRATVDKYKDDFKASVFHEDAVFLDLIENMPTDTWQSVLGTLICMGAVCFLFLNSFFTVVMASTSVLSICAGILGILSWWGVDLDPITMAAMIISIGCSVDIPAHVSYHYYQASKRSTPDVDDTPEAKLVNCLSSVAFPAVQAGVSTILCVCSLLFVKLYMSMVFVKTMVVCVVLCNIHGLIFLPAFLIIFDSCFTHAKNTVKKVKKAKNKNKNVENGTANPNRRRIQPQEDRKKDHLDHMSPDRPQLSPDPSPLPSPKPSTGKSEKLPEANGPGNVGEAEKSTKDSFESVNLTRPTTIEIQDSTEDEQKPVVSPQNSVDRGENRKPSKLTPQKAVEEELSV
ncbi:unnamed protein product [Bursaphelenchus xylophilus]|uniref:(pine wood nematode) hypothetical protein n=1 Tax=Bursaphelenchus xylophilus TaxID=6326 RepID=A0A1I7RLN7_BURXY|nr:unnamed protein product [Bursaphelenchus xylophilus]CAG9082764.1 unnamed protein product [Bursaphelenchus xylophilus]